MSKTDQNSIIGLFEAHSLLLRVNLRSAVTSDCPDPTVVDVANWWWTISNFWCMGRPWPGPAVLCWLLAAKSLSINLYLRRMALVASIPHQAAVDQHTVENIHSVQTCATALELRDAYSSLILNPTCDLGSGVMTSASIRITGWVLVCCLVCGRGRVVVAWDSAGHNQCLWFVCLLQWHPTPLCWGEL